MGISLKTLQHERVILNKTFTDLNTKIQTIEKELTTMRNNLNAVHGALQQVDKLISIDNNHKEEESKNKIEDKTDLIAKKNIEKSNEKIHKDIVINTGQQLLNEKIKEAEVNK